MAVDVITEIVINRPRQQVADYSVDPLNAPRWYANIRSAESKTAPPVRAGSQFAFVAQFLGRRLAYTYEVTDYIPGQRLVMRMAEGPFPMETTYIWDPAGDGRTSMTLRNRGEPSGFSGLMSPLIAAAMRRENRKDLIRLKALLEGQGVAGAG